MKIPDQFVAELRDRLPIVDVIGDYVDLKPEGADRHVGLCPFHSERTGSFKVRGDYQRYRCYGCGESGDVIDFLRQVEGLEFREAIEQLAAKAGLPIPAQTAVDEPDRDRMRAVREVLTEAHSLFQQWLIHPSAEPARTYLTDRCFDLEHRDAWELGYNPPGNQLLAALTARGYDRALLSDAGLVKQSQRGTPYDVFGGRLIWPLHDKSGRLVGFAGRALDENARGKFINSEDSPIYHKRNTLFGLWRARKEVLSRRAVIVVEGYTDVMALAAAGHPNTVATCGTAVTAEHAALLAGRVGDQGQIVAGFDNDAAGRAGAWALFLACQEFTTQISALDYRAYGQKADACDVRRYGGDGALTKIADSPVSVLQILIDADTDLGPTHTPEQVALAAHHVRERLRQVQSPILRGRYLQYAAERLNVTAAELGGHDRTATAPPVVTVEAAALDDDPNVVAATLIEDPATYERALAAVGGTTLTDLLDHDAASMVEISWSGYPNGRPRSGEDAGIWADYMADVVPADQHPRLWAIAFAAPNPAAVTELVVRARRLQLAAIIDSARTDPARNAEYMDAYRQLRALRGT